MAVFIPIISEFDSKGIDKAKKEFASLEGAGAKAQFAIKKAAVPAAAAIAGLGAALFSATQDAIADDAAQAKLALTMRNTTGATDEQIKATEDWISQQGKALGITDDELRPALGRLMSQTHDVTKAQELMSIAMDVAQGTGKSLSTVTEAMAKAAAGSTIALGKLSPELKQMEKDGASADEMMAALAGTFQDQASIAAGTAQGQFQRLGVALAETKESIGAALLPAIEAVLPYLTKMGDWAAEHPEILLGIGIAIATIAAAIVAVNVAMALNPFSLIAIAVVGLGALLVTAYKKFEPFKTVVDAVFGGIEFWITEVTIPAFRTMYTVAKTIFNGIARIWNNTFGKLSFSVPDWVPGIGGKGFDVPNIPMLAEGGIVTGPTLAMIGEGNGPEAVIPLSRMGEFGMGGGINITVNAGLVSTPDQIGMEIIAAIQKAQRRSGTVFAAA
jgi:hypothetical protein